ncbi:MAG: hypothetical protein JOY59_13845 [Candidatus Eremiobacteraeota bacterium]|nr:hypothetical protein [Candidatus Eremiobacteraeota bacterium]
MRRFALTLFALLPAVALVACSGYQGSLDSSTTSNPTSLVFTEPGASANGIFKVAPGATTPLLISVLGRQGSTAVVNTSVSATWAITYGATSQFYTDLQATQQPILKACPAVAAGSQSPAPALVVENPGTTSYAQYASGFYQTVGILPSRIVVAAPNVAPGATYCLNVVATTPGGQIGSVVVFVTN